MNPTPEQMEKVKAFLDQEGLRLPGGVAAVLRTQPAPDHGWPDHLYSGPRRIERPQA